MKVTRYDPGTVCWLDLGTSDPEDARAYYTDLFGWTYEEMPTEQGPYTMFRRDGRDVCALYEMGERQPAPGWNTYFCTEDVEAAGRRAAELGGTVLRESMDVMEHGRMAMVQDPTGAVFALWEPRAHVGAGLKDEPGAMCWHELYTRDLEAAETFYRDLFGYTTRHSPEEDGSEYVEFLLAGQPVAGMMAIREEWGDQVPPNWGIYLCVRDLDACMQAHAAHGGRVDVEPSEAPGHGRFALLSDPQGAHFGVFEFTEVAA